ncbi:hypothetical protein ACFQGE_14685 [Halomicroarcula sp. GCM10025817]|uniref:hypothetical protein n=1 Tax=Haloarcula TaxID=2237 RepID=UPI0023E89F92|nr:hypothetical protein [Halomicroarcula sp. SYNS111]
MHTFVRILVALILVAGVFGLGTHYSTHRSDHWEYPTYEELDRQPGEYVGEQVFVQGDVVEVDATVGTGWVRVMYAGGAFTATVDGFDASVRPGGVVQVYGVFRPGRAVAAETVRVVNPAGASKAYKYVVSAVGALFVLALFFRYWRFDLQTLTFEVR